MNIALFQPYFLPYLGYFSVIASVDRFVFFDSAQYIRRGWSNRNRVLDANGCAQYITVPVRKHPRTSSYREVWVDESRDWRSRMWARVETYRGRAPCWSEGMDLLQRCVAPAHVTIGELARHSVRTTCELLGLTTELDVFPDGLVARNTVEKPGDWGWALARATGATGYHNAPGGRSLYDPDVYRRHDVELRFVVPRLRPYRQLGTSFVAGLSVLDAVFCVGLARTAEMAHDYVLEAC